MSKTPVKIRISSHKANPNSVDGHSPAGVAAFLTASEDVAIDAQHEGPLLSRPVKNVISIKMRAGISMATLPRILSILALFVADSGVWAGPYPANLAVAFKQAGRKLSRAALLGVPLVAGGAGACYASSTADAKKDLIDAGLRGNSLTGCSVAGAGASSTHTADTKKDWIDASLRGQGLTGCSEVVRKFKGIFQTCLLRCPPPRHGVSS